VTEDNRIPEIRAAIGDGNRDHPSLVVHRILAILDSAPPAPRVFFPGDTVPAGTWVMNDSRTETRSIVGNPQHDWRVMFGPCVEIFGLPSPEEWQAAIDQAEADRATAEWRHTEGTTP
jgi:hypothetical protein